MNLHKICFIFGCFFLKGCYNESTTQASTCAGTEDTMSKIICDVCGSAYADTASQCPICGTAKRDNNPVTEEITENVTAETGYGYVKGGRFSHSNVRKRNSGKELHRKPAEKPAMPASTMPPLVPEKAQKPAQPKQDKPAQPKPEPKAEKQAPKSEPKKDPKPESKKDRDPSRAEKRTNLILLLVVLILLVAVIFVAVYIVRNYKDLFPPVNDPTDPNGSSQSTVGGVRIPCVGITLPAVDRVESDGSPVRLEFAFTPSTTTDDKTFTSSDPSIATVDDKGAVTIHANGQVTVTVTCGEQSAELTFECVFVTPTDPTDPSVPIVEGTIKFVNASNKENPESITFSKYGEEYQLYAGDIDASLVTFTSSDPAVVTVDAAGKIKIVGKGIATVTAEYGTQKVECKIICSKVEVPSESTCALNYTDVTMKVGERLTIQLLDKETGAPISGLSWYISMPGTNYISIDEIGTGVRVSANEVTVGVKGVAYVRVMCDYEGVTYTCIVRVKAAPEES